MPFLTGIVRVEDSNGTRIDVPNADGTHAPIVLKLDSTMRGTPVQDGSTVKITLSAPGAGGGGVVSFADHATFRSLADGAIADGQVIHFQNPIGDFVYYSSAGAGQADDDVTILKRTATSLGSNGRAYNVNAPSLPNIAALRLAVSGRQKSVFVQGHFLPGDGGARHFDLDPADTSTADNSGTIIVAGSIRYKARVSNRINAKWFGAKGDARSIAANFNLSAASTSLGFSGTNLTADDVGKTIWIAFDDSTTEHKTTILSVDTGGHTAVLTAALPTLAFTTDDGTDLVTFSVKSYANGTQIKLSGMAGGGGLSNNTTYYVRDTNLGAKTCKLETAPGAGVIDITADRSGTIAVTSGIGAVATNDSVALAACAAVVQATSQVFYQGVGYIQRPAFMFLPPGDYYCATSLTALVSIDGESASLFTGSRTEPLFDLTSLTGKITWEHVTIHHTGFAIKAWGAAFNPSFVPDLIFYDCRAFFVDWWLAQNVAINCNVKIAKHHGEAAGALKGVGFIGEIDGYTGISRLDDNWNMVSNGSPHGGDWSGGGFVEIGGTEDAITCDTSAVVATDLRMRGVSLSPGVNNQTGPTVDQEWFKVQSVCNLQIDGRFGGESGGMPLIRDIAGVDGCVLCLGDNLVCPSGTYGPLVLNAAWERLQFSETANINYADTSAQLFVGTDAFKKAQSRNWMHPTLRADHFPVPSIKVTGDLASATVTNPVHLKVVILSTGARGVATFKVSIDGGATYGSTQTTAATYAVPATSVTLNFEVGTFTINYEYISVGYLQGQISYPGDTNHSFFEEPNLSQASAPIAELSQGFKASRHRNFSSANVSGIALGTFSTTTTVVPSSHLDSANDTINGVPAIKWFSTDDLAIAVTSQVYLAESLTKGWYTALFLYRSVGMTASSLVAYSTLGSAPPRVALPDTGGAVRLATYTFWHDGGNVSQTHPRALTFSLRDGADAYFTMTATSLVAGQLADEFIPNDLPPVQIGPYLFIGGDAAPTTGTWQKGNVVWNAAQMGAAGHYDFWVCTVTGTPGTWVGRNYNPLVFTKSSSSIGTLGTGLCVTDEHTCSGVLMGWRTHVAYSLDLDTQTTPDGWLVTSEANANGKIKTRIINLTGSAAPSLGGIDFVLYAWPPTE